MKTHLIILAFYFIGIGLQAQENKEGAVPAQLKPNALYVTAGLFGVSGNYERMIGTTKENTFVTSYGFKVGYGFWAEPFGGSGTNSLAGLTALSGSGKNHLEINIGLTSLFDRSGYDIGVSNAKISNGGSGFEPSKSEYRDVKFAGSFGYRFQKPNGKFIFRGGIGVPDYVYFSLGFCF